MQSFEIFSVILSIVMLSIVTLSAVVSFIGPIFYYHSVTIINATHSIMTLTVVIMSVVMLSVVMLNVVMLSVVMLSVLAPYFGPAFYTPFIRKLNDYRLIRLGGLHQFLNIFLLVTIRVVFTNLFAITLR